MLLDPRTMIGDEHFISILFFEGLSDSQGYC